MLCRIGVCPLILLVLSGCALFGHDQTPPQQFLDALGHGNYAQAHQIWLGMTPHDRANLAHSIGVRPSISPDNLERELMQRAPNTGEDEPSADEDR